MKKLFLIFVLMCLFSVCFGQQKFITYKSIRVIHKKDTFCIVFYADTYHDNADNVYFNTKVLKCKSTWRARILSWKLTRAAGGIKAIRSDNELTLDWRHVYHGNKCLKRKEIIKLAENGKEKRCKCLDMDR